MIYSQDSSSEQTVFEKFALFDQEGDRQIVPVLKKLSASEISNMLFENRKSLKAILKQYLIQRNVENMRPENEFQFDVINGHTVKKRKPTTHFDIIIEEYLNLRKLNRELHRENQQRMQSRTEERKQIIEPFRMSFQANSVETHDFKEAFAIQEQQDQAFEKESEQLESMLADLRAFQQRFDEKYEQIRREME